MGIPQRPSLRGRQWKAHKREGRGIERSANGDVYEGEYKAGKREGQGTYLCADGRIEVGFYKAGTRVGESVLWTNCGRPMGGPQSSCRTANG